MQYFKMINDTIDKFCTEKGAKKGFKLNFLKNSNSRQCKEILAIYEQASEIFEEVNLADAHDVANADSQLLKLYEDLLKIA